VAGFVGTCCFAGYGGETTFAPDASADAQIAEVQEGESVSFTLEFMEEFSEL
jgi:hypothetical protein